MACTSAGIIGAPAAITYSSPAIAAAPFSYSAPALAAPLSYSAPALTSQSSNIYRSFGNLGQISTYSKTIDTPFSSVRKSDVRVSNPGVHITEPLGHSLIGVAYSAAPAVSHISFDSGLVHYAF